MTKVSFFHLLSQMCAASSMTGCVLQVQNMLLLHSERIDHIADGLG